MFFFKKEEHKKIFLISNHNGSHMHESLSFLYLLKQNIKKSKAFWESVLLNYIFYK